MFTIIRQNLPNGRDFWKILSSYGKKPILVNLTNHFLHCRKPNVA